MFDQFQVSKNVLEKQKELLPLAASIKGEVVSVNDLKRSVTIAIQTIKKVLKRSAIINDSKSEAATVTVLHNAEIALQQLIRGSDDRIRYRLNHATFRRPVEIHHKRISLKSLQNLFSKIIVLTQVSIL